MARTRQVADHTAHSNEIHPRTQVDEEIPSGSWTPPLNWELCATSTGDIITPFAHHVRIGPTTHTNATFPQFQNLPAELQLQILSNCDRVTVWSIMRASPNLRKEARAAFWSDSNIWYPVDGFWLWNGGFAGDTDHDMHFLKLVQQVEITFHRIKDVWDRESLQDRQPELMDEFLETFWRIFKELYPNAVKVVISELWPARTPTPDYENFIRTCPPSIDVAVVLSEIRYTAPPKRRLVAKCPSNDNEWINLDLAWDRQIITPPPKLWRGPLGGYHRCLHAVQHTRGMRLASRELALRAWVKNLLDTRASYTYAFKCPFCNDAEWFAIPEEWMAHAQLEWHPVLAELPEEYKEFMGNREKKIEDILKTRYLDPLRLLLARWGKRGSQEYAQVREAMKLQLENDPEYASQFSIVHVTEDIDSTLFEISMEEKDIPGNA